MNQKTSTRGPARSALAVALLMFALTLSAFADITDSSLARRIGRSLEPAWVFLPVGIFFTVASIRALWRGEKPKYTDEDAARAKKALDRMYLKEHGKLPEEDKEENDKKEAP